MIAYQGLIDFLNAAREKNLEFHALSVTVDGRRELEWAWEPYSYYKPHMLFSLSKSFCSCAAGFAVAEGLLRGDSRVIDILPDKAPANPSENISRITLDTLLCMGSGLDPKSDETPEGCEDWAKYVLSCEGQHEPGTHFHYNSHGTYLVSAMVQRVTGMTVRDYLMPRLFDKLGIEKPDWDSCPEGINCGGWGLHLSCADISKFGQLLLQDGVWGGERVLPEGWVERATTKKIDNYTGDITSDWQQGYCQQFWRCRENRYRGDGAFGQLCYIVPDKNAVIAVTAGMNDMGAELNLIHDILIPAIGREEGSADGLRETMRTALRYAWPEDDGDDIVVCGDYKSEKGDGMTLRMDGEELVIDYKPVSREGIALPPFAVRYGKGAPVGNEIPSEITGGPAQTMLAVYGRKSGALHTAARMPLAPFARIGDIRFTPEGLRITVRGAGEDEGAFDYKKV